MVRAMLCAAAAAAAAAAATAFPTAAAAPVTAFGPPSSTGHSSSSRRDAVLLTLPAASADEAHVLASGVVGGRDTLVQSADGGRTWDAVPASLPPFGLGWLDGVDCTDPGSVGGSVGGACVAGTAFGVPQGYLTNTSEFAGPWTAKARVAYAVNATDGQIHATAAPPAVPRPVWAAPPHPVGLLAFDSGGIARINETTSVATAWIWYADAPIPEPGKICCNGSVVSWITTDGGNTWDWRGEVASKQSINAAAPSGGWPVSQEGPNENDVVLLRDGKTLLCILRIDGGDGVPTHAHVPYVLATSTDLGLTWDLRAAPPFMLSARPRAVVLPNGALAVAGGRPALAMWVSADGFGKEWEQVDIPTVHNAMNNNTAAVPNFCPEFERANATLGWMQSSCYNRFGVLSHDTGLVCYEMQGAASGGAAKPPPQCAFPGSEVFCMRFTVEATGTE